jgi:hypothetical protein
MTPKEKALELVEDMHDAPEIGYNEHAKQCALIAVDEIFKTGLLEGSTLGINKKYWQEVKQEIEAL